MQTQAVPKPSRPCALQTIVVRQTKLILYASFRDVFQIPPTPDDPWTITTSKAVELSGLSRRTLDRMIAAGKADVAA